MYGIGEHNTSSISAWRLMFIICGVLTSVTGVIFVFVMPSGPETAWFLTPEERLAAGHRLASQHDGGDKKDFSVDQFKEAMSDFKCYAAFAFGVLVTAPSVVLTVSQVTIMPTSLNNLTTKTVRLSHHQAAWLHLWCHSPLRVSFRSSAARFHLDWHHSLPNMAR